jgi:MFS family permease
MSVATSTAGTSQVTLRVRLRDLTLMSSSMIAIIGTTAIAASLPKMSDAYASTPNGRFLVNIALTLPALAIALFAPLMGLVIDRWGRKKLFAAFLVLYGLSGTAGFYAPSLEEILVTRFLLGVSVAGITTCATVLIADYSDKATLGKFMGQQSLFMALGNVIFVSLGGVLANHSWRWPFMIYAIAFVVLPGVIFLIIEPRLAADMQAMVASGQYETLPAAQTVLIYFLCFINMIVYFMVPVYLPFYVNSFPGNDSARSGALLALVGLTWGITSTQYHRLRRKVTFGQIVIAAFTLMGVAHLLLASASSYVIVIFALVLIGIGLGVVLPNLNAWLLSFAPATVSGRLVGGLVFFGFIGQFVSPIITRPLSTEFGISTSYFIAGTVLLFIALSMHVLFSLNPKQLRSAKY